MSKRLSRFNLPCADELREGPPGGTIQGRVGSQTPSRCKSAALVEISGNGHCLARPNNSHLRERVRGRRFACFTALLLAVYFQLSNRTVYADQSPTEYQVKAAYLFNFLKFVEWPDDPP